VAKLTKVRDIKLDGASLQVFYTDGGTVILDYNAVSVCLRSSFTTEVVDKLIEALDEANAHAAKVKK